ncbi:MAG: hypothetical protein ACR2JT_02325 [Nocardioidaceae bacterium]
MAHPTGTPATRGGGDGDLIEKFQPSAGRWFGVVGIGVLCVLAVLLVADHRSAGTVATAVGFVLFALTMWVSMVRPTVHAYTDHLLVRNLVSDVVVPWHLIRDAEVRQTLRVYSRDRVVNAVAVGRTVRQQVRASRPGLGVGTSFGMGRSQAALGPVRTAENQHSVAYQDFVAERIMLLAGLQKEASRHHPSVVRRWAYVEIAALIGVAVAFVIVLVIANR